MLAPASNHVWNGHVNVLTHQERHSTTSCPFVLCQEWLRREEIRASACVTVLLRTKKGNNHPSTTLAIVPCMLYLVFI